VNVVNRTALSIKPKEPYLKWANFATTSYESIEDIRSAGKIILLPISAFNDQERFLEEHYRELFELELDAWTPNNKAWPQQIDLNMFKQWFDVEFFALALDFSDDELFKEPYNLLGT
jgi:hypothetical protein